MGSRARMAVLVATMLSMIVACGDDGGGDSPADTPPSVTLDGSSWIVERGTLVNETFTPIGVQIPTFAVDGDRATGSTGCNSYDATISLTTQGVLAVSDLSVTEIGCEPAVMDVEAKMLGVLSSVDRIELDGDRLTLSNGDGSATLVMTATSAQSAAPLDGTTWRVSGIEHGDVASSVIADTSPFLIVDLAGNGVSGNGGCNDFGAQLVIEDQQITLTERASTAQLCDEAVMAQETDIFGILDAVTGWQITGDTLRLETTDDRALTLIAEANNGSPSDSAVGTTSCVSEYSAETLRERAFAFDGTVTEVRAERDPNLPADDPLATRALFDVHRWFAGGADATVLVWMQRDVAIGERLLVAGEPRWDGEPLDDAIAWECGFTATYSDALAAEWATAVPGS